MSRDFIKFKVAFVDSRNSKVLQEVTTKPIQSVNGLQSWLDSYFRYLLTRPYTRLIITPVVDCDTGELFTKI